MRKLLKPWLLVSIGVVMNVLSALISQTLVERNMRQMDSLMDQSDSVQLRIDTLWNNFRSLERTQQYYSLLLLTANSGEQLEAARQLVHTGLTQVIKQHELAATVEPSSIDFTELNSILNAARNNLINRIDDIYLEKITAEKQRRHLHEQNERLRSIALFLQLIGLILVLSRDIVR